MSEDDVTRDTGDVQSSGALSRPREVLALVIAWTASEPERTGEIFAVPERGGPWVLGRGETSSDDEHPHVLATLLRPGAPPRSRGLANPFLSRAQLTVRSEGGGVRLENVGKRALEHMGREVTTALVREGETVEVKGQLLLYCIRRSARPPELRNIDSVRFPFGEPDEHGIVGESPKVWELRDQLAFVARRRAHVLVLGPSGTGKELVARAIHGQSPRARRRMVSRNAATIPAGLASAELFGNVKNYPHAGMLERPGLVGEADGSTLFLDEIGELPEELQAQLLRVLDEGGEYQRLGEARARLADIRLIGATNRDITELKHDLVARLRLRVHVPSLADRREDIPLLLRHALWRAAQGDPEIAERFFEEALVPRGAPSAVHDKRLYPRVDPALVAALLRHPYETHVRELEALLWVSLSTSRRGIAELTPEVEQELARRTTQGSRTSAPPQAAPSPQAPPSAEEIEAVLARHGGSRELAWRDLGLSSRYALKRLMKKYGLQGGGE